MSKCGYCGDTYGRMLTPHYALCDDDLAGGESTPYGMEEERDG